MDKMMFGKKIFLALFIVVIMGMLVVPGSAYFYMESHDQKDLMGSDYNMVEGLTPGQCANRCLSEVSCKAATYVKPGTLRGPSSESACWLKNSVPSGNSNINTISWSKKDSEHPTYTACFYQPLTADFLASPVQGPPSLTVSFTDSSIGSTSWNWDFNNDGVFDSYEKNPTYTYNNPGTYTVKLLVGGGWCAGNTSKIRDGYITVIAPSGSIDVSSLPIGAKVSVDSVYKGLTPITVTNVTPGTHSVDIALTNYTNRTEPVTVTAGTTSRVSVTLAAMEGSGCDDGNKCTENDIIKDGVCAGTPKVCDDNKSETEDTCTPATGTCVFTVKKDGETCDDKNPCTVNDVMKGGACTPGTPLTCDDRDPATADTCDPKSGCVYTPLKPMLLSVTSSSLTVYTGESADLIITVVGAGNIPVADAIVELSSPQGGALVPYRGATDSMGKLASKFSAPKEGTYTINTTVIKDGYLAGSQPLTITVKPGIIPWTFLPFILVIAVIAIIVLFLLTRNRLQLIVKQTSVPADGRSTIPVKVQFASGLGSLKNQAVDRDVSLTATSGTIKPALISRGKAFAETLLTASKEVGKVKVTAQYGNQQAEAMVNFTIEGGMIEISADPKELPADGKSAAMITLKLKDRENNPISFMDEKTMQISTTLGTIPGSITVPPHTIEVKTSIVSGTVSGTATITGIVDQLKGGATVKIGALAERYCQRCGTKVSMETIICPNCRQSPTIPDTDTQQCPFCKEELPRSAIYCNKCGRNQAQKPATAPQLQYTQRGPDVIPKKKFCGDCGAELPPGMKFCNNCGAKIN